jgi:cytochrome o ubiquinol oxidase subunit 2
MNFKVESTSEEAYQEWVESVKQSKNTLDMDSLNKLAEPTIDHPVKHYRLKEKNLFKKIIMHYMRPDKPKIETKPES